MRPITTLLCAVLLAARLPALAAPAAAPAASPTSAPRVPIAAFVNDDQYALPRLAPDGKHIAITVRTPAGDRPVPMVTVYSLPELKVEGVIRMPVFEVPIDYRWVSNTRLVISRGLELGSREKPLSTGELIATDYDGKKQEYLHGYRMYQQSSRGRYPDDEAYGYIEDVARDFNGHAMVTSRLWDTERTLLYDIDTRNGTRRLAAELSAGGMAFLIQHDGKPRFAYGTDEENYTQVFRRNDTTGAWDKLANIGHRYNLVGFSDDDSQVAAMYSKTGEPEALVREDLKTGERKTLFSDHAAEPAGLLFGPGRGMPFGAHSAIGVPHAVYFDENDENARLHKLLSQQFPGSWVGFHSFSADGKLLLFSVSSDRDPGSYYLFNRTAGTADLLFSAMQGIDPDRMGERRPISFPTRDKHTLYGFLTIPAATAGARPPLVLLPHGGPHGVADEWFFDTDAQFLASRGYAVLQVNFRGSDGRGSNFMHAGFREWGGKVQDDLVDGVNWAVSQGLVDPNRICVYGASFGGYAALMLAAREPAMFKCAVGYAGVYDLNLMATTDEAKGNKRFQAQLKRYIGTDKAELDRFSPAMQAAQIKAPVLLVHGGKDKRAPLDQAEAMRAALVQAGRPPEWFVAPNEGHGFYDTKNVTEFYQRLEAFLAKHLGQ
jgi:dipeptidyl aminopeptidase/acylaminoacyl peptidase